MNDKQKRDAIFNKVWRACDTFRGVIDPAQYKDYILTMLFVKYLSDIHKSKAAEFAGKYQGDAVRVQRALARERFVIPEIEMRNTKGDVEDRFSGTFDSLFERRDRSNVGELINVLLEHLEDANKAKLHNVFRNIDFNSEANLGQTRQRNTRLNNLLEDLAGLDLRPESVGHMDIIGDVYEYLIEKFAATAGKKAGEFYTPAAVSETLARLVAPKPGDRICDPACGSGGLLIEAADLLPGGNSDLQALERLGAEGRQVHKKRLAIEMGCLSLIASRRPLDGELRPLVAMVEIAAELERMGDHAQRVALSLIHISEPTRPY
mgnify:CR=1 FL=1